MTVISLIRHTHTVQPEYLFFILLNLMPIKDVILTALETQILCLSIEQNMIKYSFPAIALLKVLC